MTQQNRSTESLFKRTVTLSLQQTWVLTPVLYGWGDTCASSAKFQAKEREDAKGNDQTAGERTANKSQRHSSPLFEPAVRQARQGRCLSSTGLNK